MDDLNENRGTTDGIAPGPGAPAPESQEAAPNASSTRDDVTPDEERPEGDDPLHPNPPRTTTDGWLTAPEFGAAGSGGAEYEPGPETD